MNPNPLTAEERAETLEALRRVADAADKMANVVAQRGFPSAHRMTDALIDESVAKLQRRAMLCRQAAYKVAIELPPGLDDAYRQFAAGPAFPQNMNALRAAFEAGAAWAKNVT
jgi:hypothetical protein